MAFRRPSTLQRTQIRAGLKPAVCYKDTDTDTTLIYLETCKQSSEAWESLKDGSKTHTKSLPISVGSERIRFTYGPQRRSSGRKSSSTCRRID